MFQLEEAADAVGIYVVADGGAAEFDGVFQYGLQRCVQLIEFGAFDLACGACWPDACAEEAFVCVDVAYAVQQ